MMEEELTNVELDVVEDILGMRTLKPASTYDPEKLEYNSRYKCFEYFAKKFPKGWEYIPGFDKVIHMCQTNGSKTTPLKDMELRMTRTDIEAQDEKIDVAVSER